MNICDPIAVVEAAYRLDCGEEEWIHGLATTARPLLQGTSLFSFTYLLQPGRRAVWLSRYFSDQTQIEVAQSILASMSPAAHQRLFSSAEPLMTLGEDADARCRSHFQRHVSPLGVADSIIVVAFDPSGAGVVLGTSLPRTAHATRPDRQRWRFLAAHIAAGLRLRRRLQEAAAAEEIDAVLTPSGQCVFARGAVKAPSVRDRLRRAALQIDSVRCRKGRAEPEEALSIWRALVVGRWSLVDRFEKDGRRYIIARRNEPRFADPRGLSQRERQVAAYAALGHSNKLISYCLGLSPSTVATHLARALRKLGLGSRVEVVRELRPVARSLLAVQPPDRRSTK